MQLKGLLCLFLISCFLNKPSAQEQKEPTKSYSTTRADSELIIDGKLNDAAWDQVEWGGDFVGYIPEYKAKLMIC